MMTPSRAQDNSGVWKYIATSAISILIYACVAFLVQPKAVTMDQMREAMPGLNPYTQDAKEISAHLANIDNTLAIMQARQQQQAQDIASIAATINVTARPVAAPPVVPINPRKGDQ